MDFEKKYLKYRSKYRASVSGQSAEALSSTDKDGKKQLKYKIKYQALKDKMKKQKGGVGTRISSEQQIDDTHFWSHQLMEHSLFLYLGIEEPQLKQRGADLHLSFKTYTDRMVARGVDTDKIVLDAEDYAKLKDLDLDEIFALTARLKEYKQEILTRLKAGEWLGWIWKTFVSHVLRELDFFIKKISNTDIDNTVEISFWNQMNSEHVGMGGHLLDPEFANDTLVKQAFDLAHALPEGTALNQESELPQEFNNLHTGEKMQYLNLSRKYAADLDEFARTTQAAVHANTVASIIHPVLIDHIVREGQRSMIALSSLKA